MQRFHLHTSALIKGKGLYWIIAYLMFASYGPLNEWGDLAQALMLGVTMISVAYTLPGLSRTVLSGTDVSYGVYIYHGLVINIFVELGRTDNWLFGAGVFLLTYILGYLSWVLVERSCIKRKAKTIRA
jgi:peptidoglycan/LPS O-acetylase OafA/YrhL